MNYKSIYVVKQYFPIVQWLSNYRLSWLSKDFIAGLTVWAVMVPTALAYTGIVGVHPVVGLYTVPLCLLAYAFFGTSRALVVGPDSATALLSAHTIAEIATKDSSNYLLLTSLLAFLVGIFFVGFGLLRMGWVANFISQPVMKGFVQGLALVTLMTQLPKFLGVDEVSGNFFGRLGAIINQLPQAHLPTVIMGVSSLILLFAISRFLPQLPSAFLIILVAVSVVSVFGLTDDGIALVGSIQTGLPPLKLPTIEIEHLNILITGALSIVLLDYTESLAAAETAAEITGGDINPNQEAIALGMANIGSSISSGFVVAGSLSQSAVSMVAGGKTQMASIFQAILILLTLLFLMPIFSNLPMAVLGAIVIKAMITMLKPHYFRLLWQIKPTEFALALAAGVGELIFGVLPGIAIGVVLSLVMVIYCITHPGTAQLGKLPNTHVYRDINYHPEAETIKGLFIYRFDGNVFFANSQYFLNDLKNRLKASKQQIKEVLIDAETISTIDLTASDMLIKLQAQLKARNISLAFAQVKDPVQQMMRLTKVEDTIGRELFFGSITEAIEDFLERERHSIIS